MSRAIFPAEHIVRGNLEKPRDAEFTGRYHGDQPVYAEKVPIYGKPEPLRDEAGQPVCKVWNNGRKRVELIRPIEGYADREFVIEDLGNGMTQKNYAFAPSEEDLRRQAAAEATQPDRMLEFMTKIERAMEKLGLSAEDVEELARDPEPLPPAKAEKRKA